MPKSKSVLLGLALVYTIVLLYFSLSNADAVLLNPIIKYQDKLLHFLAYLVLAFIWGLYLNRTALKVPLLISFLATFAFGIVLEVFQEYINPLRTTDLFDGISNCFGVIVGTLIVRYYQKTKVKIV